MITKEDMALIRITWFSKCLFLTYSSQILIFMCLKIIIQATSTLQVVFFTLLMVILSVRIAITVPSLLNQLWVNLRAHWVTTEMDASKLYDREYFVLHDHMTLPKWQKPVRKTGLVNVIMADKIVLVVSQIGEKDADKV